MNIDPRKPESIPSEGEKKVMERVKGALDDKTETVIPADSTTMPAASTGKWSVERTHEASTGWKGISIKNEHGLHVANIVMQLDDSEMKVARLIVDAVNAWATRPARARR
jgi:hypothetical protein